jgi:hypothetical protein
LGCKEAVLVPTDPHGICRLRDRRRGGGGGRPWDRHRSERRIEAVATTRWFAFKDDIAIRISPAANGGSVLDIRSASRVGLSDLGTNARRIRTFLKTFSNAGRTSAERDKMSS